MSVCRLSPRSQSRVAVGPSCSVLLLGDPLSRVWLLLLSALSSNPAPTLETAGHEGAVTQQPTPADQWEIANRRHAISHRPPPPGTPRDRPHSPRLAPRDQSGRSRAVLTAGDFSTSLLTSGGHYRGYLSCIVTHCSGNPNILEPLTLKVPLQRTLAMK